MLSNLVECAHELSGVYSKLSLQIPELSYVGQLELPKFSDVFGGNSFRGLTQGSESY